MRKTFAAIGFLLSLSIFIASGFGLTIEQITNNSVDDYNQLLNNHGQFVWTNDHPSDDQKNMIFLYDSFRTTQLSDAGDRYEAIDMNEKGQVVWAGWDGSDFEIYRYENGNTEMITQNNYDDLYPLINEHGTVGYLGNGLYLYDNGTAQLISDDVYGYSRKFDLNDNNAVVWRSSSSNAFIYDGSISKEISVQGMCLSPQINAKNQAVWSAMIFGRTLELYFYDGKETNLISTNAGDNSSFSLNENGQVVWRSVMGTSEIYFYEKARTTLLNASCAQASLPRINDRGQSVWMTDSGIYLSDGNAVDLLFGMKNQKTRSLEITNNGQVIWDAAPIDGESNSGELYLFDGTDTVKLSSSAHFGYTGADARIADNGQIVWNEWDGNDTEIFTAYQDDANSDGIPDAVQKGMLRVIIGPEEAVNGGAQWRVNSGAWQDSGTRLTGLAVGTLVVEFNEISGWNEPQSQSIVIVEGRTAELEANYQKAGSLQVTISPQAAIDSGAQWRIDEGGWHDSGETVYNSLAGNHSLEFSRISGWQAPPVQTVTIEQNRTVTVSLSYVAIRKTDDTDVDTDGDGVPDRLDGYPDNGAVATPASAKNPDQKITIDVSGTAACSLSEIRCTREDDDSLSQANRPAAHTFPHGLVSFKVTGLQPGETVTIKMLWPSVPEDSTYYGVNADGFYEFTDCTITGNVVEMSITDGGMGDHDGLVNGEILDSGGVAVKAVSSDADGDVGSPAADDPGSENDRDDGSGGGGGGCFIGSLS